MSVLAALDHENTATVLSYDAVGNRTQQTIGSTTTKYAYNAANQLCATVTTGTPTCPSANWTYDGNGNLTHNPSITSLVYNAKNQNTSRTQSGTTTNFTYADTGQAERTISGTTAQISDILGLASESNVRYLRDPSGTVLGERITSGASAGNYYFFTDGLGSVTHIVNSSGTYVRYYGYDAWGNTSIGSGTIDSNIRYANGYTDTNGLTKFGTRYYDPTNGRWTQQDPAGTPNGPNRYLYVNNNPTNATDPSGLSLLDFAGDVVSESVDKVGALGDAVSVGSAFVSEAFDPGDIPSPGTLGLAAGAAAGFLVGTTCGAATAFSGGLAGGACSVATFAAATGTAAFVESRAS